MTDNAAELRDLIRVIVHDKLDIESAVESVHVTAQQIDRGIKHAMPCFDQVTCDGKTCGECGR